MMMAKNSAENNTLLGAAEAYGWILKLAIAQGIIGMILNTLAWLVILRTKTLRNMTNYLLAYLAVTDSLYCLSIVLEGAILLSIHHHESSIGRVPCLSITLSLFISYTTAYSSSYGLCLVTYERYIGIVHPLHYPRLMSAKKVKLNIFISWLVSILISSPLLFTMACVFNNDSICFHIVVTLSAIFSYLLPILFMSWAYYKIQATLKRSAQQLQQENVQGAALELLQARKNVINMLRIVMGALVVFWTPTILYTIFIFGARVSYTYQVHTTFSLLLLVYHMNSVINPIIYIFKYKKFQKGFQDMLCCFIGRPLRPDRIGVQIAMNEQNV